MQQKKTHQLCLRQCSIHRQLTSTLLCTYLWLLLLLHIALLNVDRLLHILEERRSANKSIQVRGSSKCKKSSNRTLPALCRLIYLRLLLRRHHHDHLRLLASVHWLPNDDGLRLLNDLSWDRNHHRLIESVVQLSPLLAESAAPAEGADQAVAAGIGAVTCVDAKALTQLASANAAAATHAGDTSEVHAHHVQPAHAAC
jgi:hypothetical protein